MQPPASACCATPSCRLQASSTPAFAPPFPPPSVAASHLPSASCSSSEAAPSSSSPTPSAQSADAASMSADEPLGAQVSHTAPAPSSARIDANASPLPCPEHASSIALSSCTRPSRGGGGDAVRRAASCASGKLAARRVGGRSPCPPPRRRHPPSGTHLALLACCRHIDGRPPQVIAFQAGARCAAGQLEGAHGDGRLREGRGKWGKWAAMAAVKSPAFGDAEDTDCSARLQATACSTRPRQGAGATHLCRLV